MRNNVERMRKHLYDVYMILDDGHEKEKEEIAVFMQLLESVDAAIAKLRDDIIG